MKWWVIGLGCLALAGCGKGPGSSVGEPDVAGNTASGVAFDYSYSLALPSARIADLQDQHARACEQLGPARCRITGLRYSVGSGGAISASLSVKVAAALARGFGRDGIKAAEAVGATLTGAEITGTDAATDSAAATTMRTDADTGREKVTRDLARTDLPAAERAELRRQLADLDAQARDARASTATLADRLATTPLTFAYETGRGSTLIDRVRDAGDTALESVGVTLTAFLWIVAALGPPLLVLALMFLLWRRWGRHWWRRLMLRTAGE